MGRSWTYRLGEWGCAVVCAALVWMSAGLADAQTPDDPTGPKSLDAIFEDAGLAEPDGCIEFREWQRLRIRQKRWREAIRTLARRRPERLYGWLIGARRPPARAVDEAKHQRDCLLESLLHDALERWPDLRIDIDPDSRPDAAADRLPSWIATSLESRRGRRRLVETLTVSHYRTALSQAHIWRRKFVFVGSSFNRVSAEAAETCELRAGTTWKPERARHTHCWRQVLSPTDREREMLAASSAPGLSRHHWGTEFDFFSLDPADFAPGGPRADEYEWMDKNARGFGFFQPYRSHTATYIEERWHWSYYPIAQALTKFASNHREKVDAHLQALWDRLETRFHDDSDESRRYFGHIRQHWKTFMFDVFEPNFERGRRR